jgi:hypothetical protein
LTELYIFLRKVPQTTSYFGVILVRYGDPGKPEVSISSGLDPRSAGKIAPLAARSRREEMARHGRQAAGESFLREKVCGTREPNAGMARKRGESAAGYRSRPTITGT